MVGNRLILRGLKFIASHTNSGRQILSGIRIGRASKCIEFAALRRNAAETIFGYGKNIVRDVPEMTQMTKRKLTDKEFYKALGQFCKKHKIVETNWANMSEEEILQLVMSKSGVGPCKFAQIISSEESIMSKLSPKMQDVIRKTQSSNPFTRTLAEAQSEVNRAFGQKQSQLLLKAPGTSGLLPEIANTEIKLIKPLSAGTVGETYLARDMKTGKEYIVKMVKKGVNAEQLQMEENLFIGFIHRFAPDVATEAKHVSYIQNLYKDWGKELDFAYEYDYNKLLQQGAKRYRVADIIRMSEDKSCILMEKAEGIQMNKLMDVLKDYKKSPAEFSVKYKELIEQNPWLANPENVMKELPVCITKSFDEMFLFMKKGGKSIMHGDPHMGNYFITADKEGKLIPVFIDTGNCVIRDGKQIQNDLKFFADYAVGNSRGVAEYFYRMCDVDFAKLAGRSQQRLASAGLTSEEAMIEALSQDIHKHVFGKKQSITDINKSIKTIQMLLEKNNLNLKPESITALKAQLQFFTNISESANLAGDKSVLVSTLIKDMPQALKSMMVGRVNPVRSVNGALRFARHNKELSSSCMYQLLSKPAAERYTISRANPMEYFDNAISIPVSGGIQTKMFEYQRPVALIA